MAELQAKPLVLIVDDDSWIRTLMAELLASEGFAVLEASDGVRGLKLAQQRSPDVILLDLALPGRSGLEVLTVLKEQQPTREIPIIIVSAYALLLLRDGLGRADGMIQKPFDLSDLLAKVREAVDRTRVPA